jgi:hypothetical protein
MWAPRAVDLNSASLNCPLARAPLLCFTRLRSISFLTFSYNGVSSHRLCAWLTKRMNTTGECRRGQRELTWRPSAPSWCVSSCAGSEQGLTVHSELSPITRVGVSTATDGARAEGQACQASSTDGTFEEATGKLTGPAKSTCAPPFYSCM